MPMVKGRQLQIENLILIVSFGELSPLNQLRLSSFSVTYVLSITLSDQLKHVQLPLHKNIILNRTSTFWWKTCVTVTGLSAAALGVGSSLYWKSNNHVTNCLPFLTKHFLSSYEASLPEPRVQVHVMAGAAPMHHLKLQ